MPKYKMVNDEKPTHAKPSLYAYYFFNLKQTAKRYGYNLVLHGSMNRDLDLVAIPWVDEPKPMEKMIGALTKCLTGKSNGFRKGNILPGGRQSFIINLNRGGYKGKIFFDDNQYYIDVSVTPLSLKNESI